MLRKIKSYFFALKAAHLQGKKEGAKAIQLLEKAIAINPNCYVAYLTLVPSLMHCNRNQEAEDVLRKALILFPTDNHLNILMAQVLAQRSANLEEIVPFVKTFMRTRTGKHEWPFFMKFFGSILNRRERVESVMRTSDQYRSEIDKWALEILKRSKGDLK